MIRYYLSGNETIIKDTAQSVKKYTENLIWIDLQQPSLEDIEIIEKTFSVDIPSRLQQEEIEISSRYIEHEDYVIINSGFIKINEGYNFSNIHISFILKDKLLITYREEDLISFSNTVKKIKANPKAYMCGNSVLLSLFETRIDMDADLIEKISLDVTNIINQIINQNKADNILIVKVAAFQEVAMKLRENIIDKQRVISSVIKSDEFKNGEKERFRILFEDINSLILHTDFLFERLEYLQNTILGLINLDQNKIIKIFTIISVVFMPPTLIASIYGMNFKNIPETQWQWGYIFGIVLMVLSSGITLLFFKKRRWI